MQCAKLEGIYHIEHGDRWICEQDASNERAGFLSTAVSDIWSTVDCVRMSRIRMYRADKGIHEQNTMCIIVPPTICDVRSMKSYIIQQAEARVSCTEVQWASASETEARTDMRAIHM